MKRKIYIILTYTGTWLSRAVKLCTRDKYCHVSIALDKDLNEMYSFGRIHVYNPFSAGFVHEYIHKGTFKRFKNTDSLIFSIDITDDQYEKLKEEINQIEMNKDSYSFNMLGLIAAKFNKTVKRKNYFYCAEFVKYVIDKSGIELELPQAVKPIDFLNVIYKEEIYRGKLREYI